MSPAFSPLGSCYLLTNPPSLVVSGNFAAHRGSHGTEMGLGYSNLCVTALKVRFSLGIAPYYNSTRKKQVP